jgi:hypothetical protein
MSVKQQGHGAAVVSKSYGYHVAKGPAVQTAKKLDTVSTIGSGIVIPPAARAVESCGI